MRQPSGFGALSTVGVCSVVLLCGVTRGQVMAITAEVDRDAEVPMGGLLAGLDASARRPSLLARMSGSAHGCDAGCSLAAAMQRPGPVSLARAIDTVAAAQADPVRAKLNILANIRASERCYKLPDNQADVERLVRETMLRPASELKINGNDFFDSNTVWGNGATATGGRATRANLTYSFPADNVTWGNGPSGPNVLNARLLTAFGNVDRGREWIRQGLATWRRHGGIDYTEVADDNAAFNFDTARVATRGDIRIGAISQDGVFNTLAYNFFPGSGGDMVLDADDFAATSFNQVGSNFRFFRNTVAHEHGHGVGFIHSTPCNETKLMEPQLSTLFDVLQIDERRGAGANYGDRFSGNNSATNAVNFGTVNGPNRSIALQNLSTNGTAGFNNSDEDWFRFTLTSATTISIVVTPTGDVYANGQQTTGCSPTNPPTINASAAGNLNIELRNTTGATVISSAAAAAAGSAETLTSVNLAAGTYTIRVVDVGPNANQTVQLYDLTMFVGGTAFTPTGTAGNAPPDAIAGLNKRVAANTTCYLIGDVNSSATMPGVTLSSYAWDSDNDGVFDLTGAKPTTVYVSNGVYPVTLRVTDSRSSTDTDTINVTVFGATTSVSSLSPNNGDQGAVVPFTIVGTNLLGVTNASQLTVSGTGVTVTGTPVRTPRGTAVTGVSFNVAANATPGPRNVSIANPDGLGAPAFLIVNAFTVNAPPPPSCPADIANSDGDPGADGVIDNGDFTLFFSAFFALPGDPIRTFADIANSDGDPGADGAVDNGDFTLFFGSFFSPCN
jgi:hypothetical protein